MRGSLDAFIREALRAEDTLALKACFIEHMDARGLDCVAYSHLAEGFRKIRPEKGFRLTTFPEEFTCSYVTLNAFPTDPMIAEARQRGLPFDWREIEEQATLSADQRRIFDEAREAGIRMAIGVPVYSRPGDVAYFSLASTRHNARLDRAQLLELQAVCQQMHVLYNELMGVNDGPKLSRREVQVLELIAQGKSNSAISEALGVSPNTVDTLVRRCFEKLGVSSRVEAALAGVAKGVILP